ncbi:MAG: hypothetical protein IJD86_03800 [Clostridia bacterium]|nr:hypothetical protein [Clostridia bacterium]
MDIERWCEWCRLRKEFLGWKNAYIADRAQISKISVDRVMQGNVKDLRISTMQAITKVLVNGTWGQYPCVMAASGLDASESSAAQCAKLIEENERLKADHKAQIHALRIDAEKEINFLKEQVKFQEEQLLAKDKLLDKITTLIEGVKK